MEKFVAIVPVYNTEDEYLVPAIESYASQKVDCDYEVLIIDDGSDERTQLTLSKLKAKYPDVINIYRKCDREGVSSARNTGLRLFDGTYLTFYDSDDYLFYGSVQLIVNEFRANPDVDMIEFAFFHEAAHEEVFYYNERKLLTSIDMASDYLEVHLFNKVFKVRDRTLLPHLNGNHRISEDKILNIKFLSMVNMALVIPYTLYFYRDRSTGIIRSSNFYSAKKTKIVDVNDYENRMLHYKTFEEAIEDVYSYGQKAVQKQVTPYFSELVDNYFLYLPKEHTTERKSLIKISKEKLKYLYSMVPRKDLIYKNARKAYIAYHLLHPFLRVTHRPRYWEDGKLAFPK